MPQRQDGYRPVALSDVVIANAGIVGINLSLQQPEPVERFLYAGAWRKVVEHRRFGGQRFGACAGTHLDFQLCFGCCRMRARGSGQTPQHRFKQRIGDDRAVVPEQQDVLDCAAERTPFGLLSRGVGIELDGSFRILGQLPLKQLAQL